MRKILIYMILIFLSSCVKETEWEISGELESVIVIDAIITDEIKRQTVTISYPIISLNETPFVFASLLAEILISPDSRS